MLKTLSADRLLKSVLATFACAIVILLGLTVASSWRELTESNRAKQVVTASQQIFAALINQRTDRATTQRYWQSDVPLTAANRAYLTPLRDAEMVALAAGLHSLLDIPFDRKDTLLPALKRSVDHLTTLQAEFWSGVVGPKSDRRPALGPEYATEGLAMQETLETISANLFASIKAKNPFISEMMAVKQLAWFARQTAGEASLLLSIGLSQGSVAPDVRAKHANFMGGARALWMGIDDTIIGLDLPPTFLTTLTQAKATLFAPDYIARQDRLLEALLTHQKPEMTADEWSPYTVPKLGVMLDVANASLMQAAGRADQDSVTALRDLILRAGLLLLAIMGSAGGFLLVSRRIIRPLVALADMTRRLSEGDLSVEPRFGDRQDEIGAMAIALATFREHAVEKARIEHEQQTERGRAEARRLNVEAHIGGFEDQVGSALGALDAASIQMDHAAADMIKIAQRGATGVRAAEEAAGEASANVSGIAAATEELSMSINEISRQVAQAAQVNQRAVNETQKTDDIVRGLAENAARIGEVINLISGIAAQTNLLALNATIEAARAGDAGKGFAVVASEVKSLANQTAKATDQISGQISAVRGVTQDAVMAIQRIRGTIDEVTAVAAAIATSVEQQGSAIQEIAQNTQKASDRTKDASDSVSVVTAETKATTETAEAVKIAATSLNSQALRLRAQVNQFMASIRAA